jgi:hypothetical protein
MAKRWWKSGQLKPGEVIEEPGSVLHYDRRWKIKMAVNAFGAVCTFVVMLMFATTKFRDGAWIVLILTPALVTIFFAIHRHYKNLARTLSLNDFSNRSRVRHHKVILPISSVHRGTLQALDYAQSLSYDVTAVHIAIDPVQAEKVRQKWELWGNGTRLVILESPYRTMIEPLIRFIDKIDAARQPGDTITVVVPEFINQKWWEKLLHMQTASWLRSVLLNRPGIVILEVPYQITSNGKV